MSPDELDDEAARLEAEAKSLAKRAKLIRALALEMRRGHPDARGAKVTSVTSASNLQRSASKAKDPAGKPDPFVAKINAAGFTVRSLALRLGWKHPVISYYRTGARAIPRDRALEIERLTGWPATSWPKVS